MESPAVDFKAGICIGNVPHGYTQFDPEKEHLRAEVKQKQHDINELNRYIEQLLADNNHNNVLYQTLEESNKALDIKYEALKVKFADIRKQLQQCQQKGGRS